MRESIEEKVIVEALYLGLEDLKTEYYLVCQSLPTPLLAAESCVCVCMWCVCVCVHVCVCVCVCGVCVCMCVWCVCVCGVCVCVCSFVHAYFHVTETKQSESSTYIQFLSLFYFKVWQVNNILHTTSLFMTLITMCPKQIQKKKKVV